MKKSMAALLAVLLMLTGVIGTFQPSFASSQTLEVTASALNYRSSPWGTIQGLVYKGETYSVLDSQKDSSSDTWYKIQKGWVHGDYVKVSGTASTSPTKSIGKVTVTAAVLNVRDAPWGTWIGEVLKGDVIDYYATKKDSSSDTWYQIKYGSGTGWVHGDFVKAQATSSSTTPTPAPTTKSYGTVTAAVLNVRDGVWGNWISEVYKGKKYELLSSKKDSYGDTWYQITYSGSSKGWVHGDFLTIETVSTTTHSASLSISANSPHYVRDNLKLTAKQTGYTSARYRFSVLESGTWKVVRDYSSSATATVAPSFAGDVQYKVEVKDASASITYTDSATAKVKVVSRAVTQIDVVLSSLEFVEGVPISIAATASGSPDPRYEISVDMGKGWQVLSKFSSTSTASFTPTAAGDVTVRVRARDVNSTDANEKVFKEVVTLTEAQSSHTYTNTYYGSLDDFVKQQLGRAVAWRDGRWSTATYDEIIREADPRVILGGAYQDGHPGVSNIRTNPNSLYGVNLRRSIWGDVAVTVPGNTALKILSTGSDSDGELWYKVNYGSQTLWVKASVTVPDVEESSEKSLGNFAMINTSSLNVRSGPGTSYSVIRYASRGDVYRILAESGAWIKIKIGSGEGWVSKAYTIVTEKVDENLYQFLDLRGTTNISAKELDKVLSGKGIFDGMGASFVEAAKKYGINEMYLISHALLETGNGRSVLATGSYYGSVKVYNMYGIGAYDSDPVGLGTKTAYQEGWTTPHKAIVGGAAWIAESYINNSSGQNTIYKMRWNYTNISHQYATDVAWARKQIYNISSLYDQVQGYHMRFEIPVYLY